MSIQGTVSIATNSGHIMILLKDENQFNTVVNQITGIGFLVEDLEVTKLGYSKKALRIPYTSYGCGYLGADNLSQKQRQIADQIIESLSWLGIVANTSIPN